MGKGIPRACTRGNDTIGNACSYQVTVGREALPREADVSSGKGLNRTEGVTLQLLYDARRLSKEYRKEDNS